MSEKIELTKEDYEKALRENICEVVFEKKDGTLRKILCTLDMKFIPQKQQDIIKEVMDSKPKRKQNPNSISVFDLEKGLWRAFQLAKVIYFKIVKKTVA